MTDTRIEPVGALTTHLTPEEQALALSLVERWTPWLKLEAEIEAMRVHRGCAFIPIGPLLACSPPPPVRREDEQSYRRGYTHGYGSALDNLLKAGSKRSAAWSAVARFLDGPLMRWRHARKAGMEIPPRFEREVKS